MKLNVHVDCKTSREKTFEWIVIIESFSLPSVFLRNFDKREEKKEIIFETPKAITKGMTNHSIPGDQQTKEEFKSDDLLREGKERESSFQIK